MFDFDKITSVALSAIGALVFTTTLVGAAVGPARAVETVPVVYAQAQAAGQANG